MRAYIKDYEDYGRTCKVYNDCLGATPQTIEWVEYGKGSGSTRSGVDDQQKLEGAHSTGPRYCVK